MAFWLLALLMIQGVGGVKVSTGVTTVEGAATQDTTSSSQVLAKHSDARDISAPPFSFARKRAFRRAIGRARAQGHTTYRGRRLTLQQLTGMRGAAPRSPTAHAAATASAAPQVCLLCWNVGGFSNAVFDELCSWLDKPDNRRYKVVMLQETHWTFSSEWVSGRWSVLHSGSKKHRGA